MSEIYLEEGRFARDWLAFAMLSVQIGSLASSLSSMAPPIASR